MFSMVRFIPTSSSSCMSVVINSLPPAMKARSSILTNAVCCRKFGRFKQLLTPYTGTPPKTSHAIHTISTGTQDTPLTSTAATTTLGNQLSGPAQHYGASQNNRRKSQRWHRAQRAAAGYSCSLCDAAASLSSSQEGNDTQGC